MNYSVTVLLPNARRQRMPVKLNTPILMILEETCKKHKLNPNEFELRFHNRTLDLTSNIQFSGITNNALLELTPCEKPRTETPVSISMQLESGERVSGSFPPSDTLWDIVAQLCSEEIKRKKHPVVIYTRQEVRGDKLKSTTLKMLGLTGGKALLRLLHRTEEQLKNQSVSSIYKLQPKPKPAAEDEPHSKPPAESPVSTGTEDSIAENEFVAKPSSSAIESSAEKSTPVETTSSSRDEKFAARVPSPMEIDDRSIEAASNKSAESSSNQKNTEVPPESRPAQTADVQVPQNEKPKFNVDDVEFIGDRYALIFHVDSMPSPKFHTSEDDDFYELTVEDAKALLRDIRRTRSELEEADLETSSAKAKKKSMLLERTLSVYPYCVVRILFPDRLVLQGVFQSTDSISDVLQFTQLFVNDSVLNFYLYVSPPKRILKADETLLDIGAIPGINLYFGSDQTLEQGNRILKEEFSNKTVPPNVAFEVANHFRRAGGVKRELAEAEEKSAAEDTKSLPNAESSYKSVEVVEDASKPGSSKLPKWFKPA